MKQEDVSLMLPSEHIEALMEVITVGLQRAKLSPKKRRELMAWWDVEREFIEIEENKENI
jgi:hypothetical protein